MLFSVVTVGAEVLLSTPIIHELLPASKSPLIIRLLFLLSPSSVFEIVMISSSVNESPPSTMLTDASPFSFIFTEKTASTPRPLVVNCPVS